MATTRFHQWSNCCVKKSQRAYRTSLPDQNHDGLYRFRCPERQEVIHGSKTERLVNAWKTDPSGSKMFIDPAVPVSVKDLLYGLIVQSGNDAAIALAEGIAGDETTFAVLMNREAERIGMKNSHFVNPTWITPS